MAYPEVLILDDEVQWLASHEKTFRERGYNVVCTRSGEEAVQLIRQHSSIRFAFLDKILFEPVGGTTSRQKQRFKGETVWRKATKCRPAGSLYYVFVTDAPRILAKQKVVANSKTLEPAAIFDDADGTFLDQMHDEVITEEARLRDLSGVIAVLSKRLILRDPDKAYHGLFEAIDNVLRPTGSMQSGHAVVVVGYGFEKEAFAAFRDLARTKRRTSGDQSHVENTNCVHLRYVLADTTHDDIISHSKERCVFRRGEGVRDVLEPVADTIKPGTREFQVLELMACKAEERRAADDSSPTPVGIVDEELDRLLLKKESLDQSDVHTQSSRRTSAVKQTIALATLQSPHDQRDVPRR